MEQILFSSQELDISFQLSDHSLSSDEDLIPVGFNKPKTCTTDVEIPRNLSKTDSSVDELSQRSKYFVSSQSAQKSGDDDRDCRTETTGRTTYYKECPLCKALGPKSINHVKQCANKRAIDPKHLVQLLAKCPKSDQSVNCSKNKFNSRHIKRHKVMDNYVISFGAQKQMKIAIDPKMVSIKSVKHSQSKYQLMALDPIERHRLLMSKINDQMLCTRNPRTDCTDVSEPSDNLLNSFCILPDIWRLSLLDSESDHYFVEGFEKYDNL